jgi:hypothetical protein
MGKAEIGRLRDWFTSHSVPFRAFVVESIMAKDRSLVRASDIGAWAFCNRAWWLAHVQHAEHENPAALSRGDDAHAAHGQAVIMASWQQRFGLLLLAAGLIFGGLLALLSLVTG